MLKQIDDRERLVELAINVRYTIHSKDVKLKKLFDKAKEIKQIESLFGNKASSKRKEDLKFADKIQAINDHFKNKHKKEG